MSEPARKRYHALQELFLAYFHEDWLDDGTREDVVREFVSRQPKEQAQRTAQELRELLAEDESEERLYARIDEDYTFTYDPHAEGITMREWLQWLLDDIEHAIRV